MSSTRASRTTAVYAAASAVMTAAALLEAGYGGQGAGFTLLSVTTSLVTGLTLLVARWSPVGAVLALGLGVVVPALVVEGLPPSGGANLIASMVLVGHAGYRLSRAGGLAAYALTALVPAVTIIVAGEALWELVFYGLILFPAWVVGLLLRREQQRSSELAALADELRRERERQSEVAVAAERTRISRELHDAVAHTVSVMTLQVGVVRRRVASGSPEEETLRGAERLGRQAVDELRRIVGLVREGEAAALAPLPSLATLADLVGEVRGTGTPVELELNGPIAEVPPAVGMSAYRVVQEGLTNALRHAPGSSVEVRVDVGAAAVEVEVRNSASSRVTPTGAPGGHGLLGLRERVHVLGGRLVAESTPDDGHRLWAQLPLVASEPVG